MRRAITAITFMLSGASALIFALALIVPLLRETSSRPEKDETVAYASPSPLKKIIDKFKQGLQRGSAVENEIQPSIKPLQETSPATAIPQIKKKSTEPDHPIAAEGKQSTLPQPMTLIVLGDGFFPSGEVTANANLQAAVDKIIPMIQARPMDKVIVEGHSDKGLPGGVNPAQAKKWNQVISFLRATAVANVLKKKGIADDRIIVRGLSDTVPIASNLTRAGRKKNRRVEIKLSPAQ